ncbi:MAG: hypothetical protein NC254_13770 [bacterium]|nr:hypothetical protein [bacterium]
MGGMMHEKEKERITDFRMVAAALGCCDIVAQVRKGYSHQGLFGMKKILLKYAKKFRNRSGNIYKFMV